MRSLSFRYLLFYVSQWSFTRPESGERWGDDEGGNNKLSELSKPSLTGRLARWLQAGRLSKRSRIFCPYSKVGGLMFLTVPESWQGNQPE
ncbi:hypothetical protein VTI74DRAFT_5904 [Chaetomium olivicolor]